MIFHVAMEPAEDGWITINCPALPGCISQGKDEQEAIANIKEAITGWLLGRRSEGHARIATGSCFTRGRYLV
jgi:predicted RNase H-like HicB family nuclease